MGSVSGYGANSLRPVAGIRASDPVAGSATSFEQALDAALREAKTVKFSAHARQRLESRDIHLGDSDLLKIERAVGKAGEKGSRESLILFDNVGLVVSVKNRVVITALNLPDIREGVVTNIDSVVMA